MKLDFPKEKSSFISHSLFLTSFQCVCVCVCLKVSRCIHIAHTRSLALCQMKIRSISAHNWVEENSVIRKFSFDNAAPKAFIVGIGLICAATTSISKHNSYFTRFFFVRNEMKEETRQRTTHQTKYISFRISLKFNNKRLEQIAKFLLRQG